MAVKITDQEKEVLANVSIPPRPKALIVVRDEAAKDDPKFPVIIGAITEDVSISAAVLQLVNSPAFRRPMPIGSIDQALNLLGIGRVLAIVNAVAVRNVMPAGAENEELEEFWEYCSAVAHAAVLLCKQLKLPMLVDDAYTVGLFHSAGVPLMSEFFEGYREFFSEAKITNWNNSINLEHDNFHTTHTTIAALMAQDWHLPEAIVDALFNAYYTNGIFISGEFCDDTLKLVSILKMARHCARVFQNANVIDDEWTDVEGEIFTYLNINESKFMDIQDGVVAALSEAAAEQSE